MELYSKESKEADRARSLAISKKSDENSQNFTKSPKIATGDNSFLIRMGVSYQKIIVAISPSSGGGKSPLAPGLNDVKKLSVDDPYR